MTEFGATRRDVLKAAGVGVGGIAGLSTIPAPAASHESVDADATDLLGPIQVPANSEAGFNYPYYLYVPESAQDEPTPMLVEPNNTGTVSDDFEEHRTGAREFSQGRLGWTRTYSEALATPLLVPVFPRPSSDPVGGNHYVHALDETTMNLDGGELQRVDLQLIAMVEHARELLSGMSYAVADKIMLNGFSASGNFVNRFTALHPDIVTSVTAGGINGTLLLPLERAKGHTLNYHVGIADIEEITGEPFDADSWREVAQFIYMGGEDENDTIPYSDAWNDRQREIALDVYGEHMQNDRMPYCEGVYDDAGANAQFEIYDGVGHRQPLEIQQDIVDFHRENAELKQLSLTSLPAAGDTTVEADVTVFDDRDRFDLRVRSDERGDITDTAASIETGESVHAMVGLATPIETGEEITVMAVPAGATDPERAVASASRAVAETPSIRVLAEPTATDQSLTVEHAVSADYETEAQIHVYVGQVDGGSRQMVGTFPPGTTGSATYELDPDEMGTALESGTELQAALVDVDGGGQLATVSFVVGDGSETTADASASVTFETQPMAGQEKITVGYAVDDEYEPSAFATLQLRTGEHSVLLDAVEPGETGTETYSIEKIPVVAGTEIEVSIVDEGPIGRSRTVVVGDVDDDVTLRFSGLPTDDDPTATVRYAIDEEYQAKDALTLRVYEDGLPGMGAGEAIALLSAGDSGTETFTVGEDVDLAADDVTVAIVDDVPLALASTGDERDQTDDDAPSRGDQDAAKESQTETASGERRADAPTGADGPGFGVASSLASIGGVSYLLKRRLDDDIDPDR